MLRELCELCDDECVVCMSSLSGSVQSPWVGAKQAGAVSPAPPPRVLFVSSEVHTYCTEGSSPGPIRPVYRVETSGLMYPGADKVDL